MSRRERRAANLAEPGLAEALAAFNAMLDEVVPESQLCTRVADEDKIAAFGDIIERAAERAKRQT
ncbi:hypothetical protein ACQPZP_14530 [Spirillospora sp. CA-142024]|uniref:hypothetical protein n=1 Tax=Spirillospora sp. CA-142024 TaxID=3240036 RepID=UPI003D8DD7BE